MLAFVHLQSHKIRQQSSKASSACHSPLFSCWGKPSFTKGIHNFRGEQWDGTQIGTVFKSNLMRRKRPVSVCIFSIRTWNCNKMNANPVSHQLQNGTVLIGKLSIWVPSLWTQTHTDSQKGGVLDNPATLCSHKREIKAKTEGEKHGPFASTRFYKDTLLVIFSAKNSIILHKHSDNFTLKYTPFYWYRFIFFTYLWAEKPTCRSTACAFSPFPWSD